MADAPTTTTLEAAPDLARATGEALAILQPLDPAPVHPPRHHTAAWKDMWRMLGVTVPHRMELSRQHRRAIRRWGH
jgi:hypothetical protein